MNVIARNDLPHRCLVCGRCWVVLFKACGGSCVRVDLKMFTNASTHGDKTVPHAHVTCNECDFTFLLACAEPDEVARLL